jgi:hypothetical protein
MGQHAQESTKWIKDFLNTKDTQLSRVSDYVPDIFDDYFLLPWNYGIIENFPFNDYPETNSSISDLNKQISIKRHFDLFLKDIYHDDSVEKLFKKISLKEIALRFNVSYTADLIKKVKSTPGLSPLPLLTKQTIKKLIESIHQHSNLYLFVADYERYSVVLEEDLPISDENLITEISLYIKFQDKTAFDSTSYLFSSERNWCLITVEDLDHFILCAGNQIVDRLNLAKDFELFKINYNYLLWSPDPESLERS